MKPALPNNDEIIQQLRARVNERRFNHIMGVADTAKHLAQVYGCNTDKAYLAGLLHDWDKCFNDDEIRARVAELGLDIDPEVLEGMCQTLHGVTAAAYFEQNYEMDPEVVQAIRVHTSGSTNMSELDMVVYIADCLEPNRQFDLCEKLRGKVGVVSLEELFLEVYRYWMILILQRYKTLHPDTLKVWNTYARRYAKQRGIKYDKYAKNL